MKLSELETLGRAMIPMAKLNKISSTLFTLIANEGAMEVASASLALRTNKKIDATINVFEYNLTTKLDRFLHFVESGVWYLNGTTSQYKELEPKTLKWFDKNIPNWRDRGAGTPQYYAKEGDSLIIHPKPDATTTNGLWLYHAQAPKKMESGDHYPFGYETEITRLRPLHWAILAFWVWKARLIINDGVDAYNAGENAYKRVLAEKIAEVDRALDISAHWKDKYQGRKIR